MKSIVKRKRQRPAQKKCCEPKKKLEVAQCCAKVSKSVAGCHD